MHYFLASEQTFRLLHDEHTTLWKDCTELLPFIFLCFLIYNDGADDLIRLVHEGTISGTKASAKDTARFAKP